MSQSDRRGFLKAAGVGLAVLPLTPVTVHAARGAKATPAKASPAVTLNVRDFGATGDGTTKDTAAIQQALDRCAVLGGGQVTVPAGTYLTGAIRIGNATVLVLDAAAVLQGSPDIADYPVT